jgi:hypothetical protein
MLRSSVCEVPFVRSGSYVDTHYDYASRPIEVSEPYRPAAPGQQAPTVYYTRTVYDEFGRVEFVRFPDGSLQTVE